MGLTQSILQEKLEPGDLIEIFRGLYSHWCLYVGDGNVIHMTMPVAPSKLLSFLIPRGKGLVKKEPLSVVVGKGRYRIHPRNNEKCSCRSRKQILRDAEALVGKEVDHDFRNSCVAFFDALFDGVFDSGEEELELGDLIEIFRGPYSHWGVYVGDENVVHLTVPDGASGLAASSVGSAPGHNQNGLVMKDLLSTVVGGGKYRVNNKHDKKYGHKPWQEIVFNAEGMVGKWVPYSLFGNNCEHFATKLRHGVAVSEQVEEAEKQLLLASGSGIGVGLGTILQLGPVAALGAAGMTSMTALSLGVSAMGNRNTPQRR